MAVYVDAPQWYAKPRAPHTGFWCHMWADTPEELRAMARKIGMRPAWIQKPGTPSEHFDLFGDARRRRAIAAGAIPVSSREWVRMIQRKRDGDR